MARLRHHLAESRRSRLSFEAAWKAALEAHPNPDPDKTLVPHVMRQARRWFEAGYYRRKLPSPDMTALADDSADNAERMETVGRKVA